MPTPYLITVLFLFTSVGVWKYLTKDQIQGHEVFHSYQSLIQQVFDPAVLKQLTCTPSKSFFKVHLDREKR